MTGRTATARGPRELAPRQVEILWLMAEGLDTREIAARLFLGRETVKTYRTLLFRALGAKNAPHAVAIGIRRGIIS